MEENNKINAPLSWDQLEDMMKPAAERNFSKEDPHGRKPRMIMIIDLIY